MSQEIDIIYAGEYIIPPNDVIIRNKRWRRVMRDYMYSEEYDCIIGYRRSQDYKRAVRRGMRLARKIMRCKTPRKH